ncbi:small RNA 2'-O-methyltransferase [Amaranthus tricolor]|uniref:small RNA 2'-O-methyltransferase n=1 Tax=Amaranthus tricolor TaxID=29722 RepID=UPI002582D76D|nr:small RNA 2'-O-methyltransferase [Amaranthus tricolor]
MEAKSPSSSATMKKPTLTPKAVIYQKFGDKARYKIEEVQEESPQNGCPGLAIPQKGPSLFRCYLKLPELSTVSQPCKKKKEAEQSAALMACNKLGIDPTKSILTVSDAADELVSRLSYIFSSEFLSSLNPLSGHLKAVSYRAGDLSGSIPVSVIIACDAKVGNLCRSIDARVESNPFLSIPLVMRAAVRLSESLVMSVEGLWIRRKDPYPTGAMSAQESVVTNGALTEAVYIPFSLDNNVRSISMNPYSEGYYLDVIAKELGVVDASKVLISRTIGKASSESRLYFSALEECNFSTISESHDAKLLSCCDSSFNIRASYLLGQHIYGNAILASIGYTWRGAELFNEDLSLRSYFRMLVARTPNGLFKLSRDALLVADLPGLFTTKTNWRGSLPRDLLCAFCRQHRLSEPVFTVVSNSNKSDHDSSGSCKSQSARMSSTGLASKTKDIPVTADQTLVETECFSCEIKLYSKNQNLILESSPVESFMKQGDAVQNASLRVLSILNVYFKQPNMPFEELSFLGADCGIKCHPTYFSKEFSLCQLMHQVQQSSDLRVDHKLNSNLIGHLRDSAIFDNEQLSIQGTACGSLPSIGSLVTISYCVLLVSEGNEIREILEKNDEFEFELGTAAVISCIETAIMQMTVGQSVSFYLALALKELVLGASMDCEKVQSFLSSKSCCLEYSVTVLRVTEPYEDRMEQALFNPPLSKQRVEFALQCIKEFSATSLIDFGCGSGSLLESLLDKPSSLEKIVGVDLSQKGLIRAAKVLNSKLEKLETSMPTSKIKSAILYDGSITTFDSRLNGFDIGACLEVIEHMEEDEACLFGNIALGLFRPRMLIVSTPNYEYNVILQKSNQVSEVEDPDDKSSSQPCKFRNHDHKFEWTREQFNCWATDLAAKYNYSVEFSGVGGIAGVEPGFASQIAVFRRNQCQALIDSKATQTEDIYKTIWKWDATTFAFQSS